VGAQELRVEVHHCPEEAVSDGAQSLYPDQFARLCEYARAVHGLLLENEWSSHAGSHR
jgi:3-deoxy-7-phosphoheptulonate synthase